MLSALKIVGEEVLKKIVDGASENLKKGVFKTSKSEFDIIKKSFPELYETHYNEICKWAFSIPFIGLSKPKQTIASTIELLIASDIVKSNGNVYDEKLDKISEDEILNSGDNILLIGAPGAGKTTTLKRLIIKYLTEISAYDKSGFPILVRLRDIPTDATLSKYILDMFGIKYEDRLIKTVKKIKTKGKDGKVSSKTQITEKIVTHVGDTPINIFIPKFLNHTEALLLLDGLDEIEKSIQGNIFREIENIGLKLTKSKILLTVRKSELNKIIDNFSIFEVAPLAFHQVEEISKKWLVDSAGFINELNKKPYKDLANRPIFLTLLMVLYDKYSFLPTQPSEVYEDTTYLIIKEWDEHRDIVRTSKYADFNTRKKLKFLSEVSYMLTYKIKQKIFSSKELEEIYSQICTKYSLPKEEMALVISEIESHTGILIESTYRNFEFSHLSIQEFLCAKHLVNLPYSQETISYFLEYPEPLAIAVSISGEPSLWFSNLILNSSLNINNFKRNENAYHSSIYALLNRLLVENPAFKIMIELGLSFFYLVSNLYKVENFELLLDQFYKYPSIKESLALALKGSNYAETFRDTYLISKKTATSSEYFIQVPYTGELPTKYINELKTAKLISVKNGNILL
jgi:predicted NACHT family NTPase